MSVKPDKLQQSHSEQLTEFAHQLQKQIADEDLLDDIHEAIEDLLWDNEEVEADIRRILQEQHKSGNLREETFELVQQMLDRMVADNVDNAPADPEPKEQSLDPFGNTTVLEDFTLDEEAGGDRLQVGSVLRDRFLLQQRVADGSMGVVYKAVDRHLAEAGGVDSSVAIRVLTPQLSGNGSALRALQQEAAKGRCLSHPNIVRLIDLDRDDDLYFVVMEWLDGRSLADILDDSNSNTIDKDTSLNIVRQLAKALDYAHRRGVVHADVKPGNIMLSRNGDVKLCDFGVARVWQKHSEGQADTDAGVPGAVTPSYSSMQVLTGEEPAASDDVFSLACLMYRLIAGYRVFGPRNAAEAADAGMQPQRPQGLNDIEWAALRKALSYSRVSRFATAQEFVTALAAPAPVHLTQPVAILHESEEEGRRLWPSLLAAAIVVTGIWGLYQSGSLNQAPSVDLPGVSDSNGQPATPQQSPPVEPDATEEMVVHDADLSNDDEPIGGTQVEEESILQKDLIDFSTLPVATVEIPLAIPGAARTELKLILREDEQPAIVDLVRTSNVGEVLVLKLEEVSFSGNRSPWESGQYQISDDSVARFPPGQDRARITVSMTTDPLREPDRQVSLLVRDFEDTKSEFALISLTLEDDDQRRFESALGPNTVAFAVGQVSVRERDPAVQIDLVRFNPDQSALTVEYFLREVTATEGDDYFIPGANTVQFGPGQRSARILIPLVQDSIRELDETFVLEMTGVQSETANANIFRRIAVMIRDDDSNLEQAQIN